ncbi:neprosin family prolyl endopeptidase [Actinoplanes sp. NPDC051851]|uniref:neprosin family prolyl endopeptidase n=1 Tax=Actinoplanes sp. NPDC051851 TaxID=3154753 RepID=UPI00343CDA6D
MFKSRRGLLAAGLAVAVVGAIGIASTLNAGADQIPGAASAKPSTKSALKPPANLPWGEAPVSVKRGRDGATSKSLKSSGLSAAAPGVGGTEGGDEYAPKGRTSKTSFLKSEKTTVVPPATAADSAVPPEPVATSSSASTSDTTTVNFFYNVGMQVAESEAAYANLTIGKPTLDKADYHSLAEVAVQSADSAQIVEVGWTVDRVVNGDDDPHLFVYHWVNKESTCYNGCGFVQYSSTIKPGDTLTQDTAKRFGIQYFNGAWWIAYDSEWVGYFPDSLWEGITFQKSGIVQVFGEVAASSATPCTQMGNGLSGEDTSSAKVGSVTYLNGPTVDIAVRTTSEYYTPVSLSTRTYRYGGPGAC